MTANAIPVLVPLPKDADNWTQEELVAYHVKVRQEDFSTFFELPELPDPSHTVKPSILTTVNSAGASDPDTFQFLRNMERAVDQGALEPSAVADFAVTLLETMKYDQMPYALCRWKNLQFIMSGEVVKAEIDVCLLDPGPAENIHLILLALRPDQDDAEPQLVASAIAAFRRTNIVRKELGLPRLEERTFASVSMEGTQPMFYKIPITRRLVKVVEGRDDGKGPLAETVVKRYVPEMPDGVGDEMRGLENRRWWMGCFEAFKNFCV
ncbi:hypothetical protein CPB84DRAFT_1676031 [Gymnopilus junonius]|uniref:Uncharacterized protein n=1 Tax=Gymnopilus junonius TaxID=109634 RepID=A0A9P5NVH5_GYMJU|nr:hypothetical protein CPB84DRAFT_1676031 [Gymnopilus junonius]